ncbi:MAG: PQQ-dependent sugar dehydrogenase, partial [Acidobacteriota bacterium]|nr:PQQ-dependent sugar dehydrogenase [Acidobacteriota bacterium]
MAKKFSALFILFIGLPFLLLSSWSVRPAFAATLPAGFTETVVASGLGSPTAMAIAPDGRIFVSQQTGQLRVVENGVLLATPFVSLTVDPMGERGLLGVALDPSFTTNHFIYLYYTVPGSPAHNRVSRFTANGNVAAAGSEVVLLDLDNLGATNHNGGAMHFGPDGKLYVAVGENAITSNAQTLSNLLGKMLRINTDGSIPTDNPFFGTATGNNRAIWALGLRNPFTFNFQPGTGRMFINDVGGGAKEEINDGIAGSNYGWPNCEGPCSPANASFRDPIYSYANDASTCAIIGGAFYNPTTATFPASFVGKYFFGDLCAGWLKTFNPANSMVEDFATGLTALVGLDVGNDGSLYYLQQGGGGQLRRIQSGLLFYPLASPVRLLDTRGLGVSPNACTVNGNQPIAANTSLLQMARGICGIPATAQAITGNVTTVTSGGGYLTLYPSGATRPTVASINYNPNEFVNNAFTVGLGADGAFNIYALNTTQVVVDVTGYYAPPGGTGLYFHPLPTPVRLLETRTGLTPPVAGCVKPGAPLPGGADSLQTAATTCTGIPAAARAIVGNATTVSPQSGGYLTLFPADASRPLIASSNYATNQSVNGPFTTGLSPSGQFKVFTLATTDLVIDLIGYYSAEANDANGAGLFFTPLQHPVRLLETRNNPAFPGCFKPNAPINGNQVYTQSARVTCDEQTMPATALGVVGNATTVAPVGSGFLTLWPSTATQPTVATSNYNGGPTDIVNRHFIVGLG